MCCLVLRSNFALLLTIQFTLLISSLINIISLLLTTFDWTKVQGIAPWSHTGRPRTCLVPHFVSPFFSLLLLRLFLRLPPALFTPPPPSPLLHTFSSFLVRFSTLSAPSLFGFLLLFSSFFVSSFSSLGFHPRFSFFPSLPIFSPAFQSYCFLLYIFFSSSFFCCLGYFFFVFSSFIGRFFIPFCFPFIAFSLACLFLPPSLLFLLLFCFVPLFVFRYVFLHLPFACFCVIAVFGFVFRFYLLLPSFLPFACFCVLAVCGFIFRFYLLLPSFLPFRL